VSLGEALEALEKFTAMRGASGFMAAEVAELLNAGNLIGRAIVVRAHLYSDRPSACVTAKSVAKRLKEHVGEVVRHGELTLVLRSRMDKHAGTSKFKVAVL
jgi:hypothetical protein